MKLIELPFDASFLYKNLDRCCEDLPSSDEKLRRALCHARHILEPLLVYAPLFNTADDILRLQLDPFQQYVDQRKLRSVLEVLSLSLSVSASLVFFSFRTWNGSIGWIVFVN